MKKILFALLFILIGIQAMGDNKYFPTGTTWTEVTRGYWWEEWDLYVVVVPLFVSVLRSLLCNSRF